MMRFDGVLFLWLVRALAVLSLSTGLVCLRWPARVIAFQQKFYSWINWRMEPISMPKEIRNTRLMGLSLVLLAVSALLVP